MHTLARTQGPEPIEAPTRQIAPSLPVLRALEPLLESHTDAAEKPQKHAPAHLHPALDPRLAGRIAAMAFEIAEGTRQVAHLARWITPEVARQLSDIRALNVERRSLYRDKRRAVPTVQRVRMCSPVPGVIEAAVVLDTPSRVRATALRFEYDRGLWRASYLAIM